MPFGAGSQSQSGLKKLKTQLIKKLRPVSTGMLVSVESSDNNALHLNMVINSKKRLMTSPFDEVSGALSIGVDVLLENVSKADVRNRVAYALKYKSIPSDDQFNGNLLNTTGNVRNAKHALNDYKLFIQNQALAVSIIYKQLLDFGIRPPAKKILMLPEFSDTTKIIHNLIAQFKHFGKAHTDKTGIMSENKLKQHINYLLSKTLDTVNLSTTDIILPGKKNIILPAPTTQIEKKKQNKTTRQRLKNMFGLLRSWGLELPAVKTVSSNEWLKFQGSLLAMVEQLDKTGVCRTTKRGALTLTEFKAVYNERMQTLPHASKPAENKNKKREKWTTRAVPKGQSLSQQEYYQQDLAIVRERRKKRNSERLRRKKHKIKLQQRKEFKLFVAHLVKWQLPPPTEKIMQSKIFCKALPRLIIMTKQLITSSYCRAKNGNVLDLRQFKASYLKWIFSIENTLPTAKKSTRQKIKDATTAGVNRVLALHNFIKENQSVSKVFSAFVLKTLRPMHSAREPP
jgi:hypothetical protein